MTLSRAIRALAIALACACSLHPQRALAQASAAVTDARGFIDPWAFGAQLRQVDAFPGGDEDGCWRRAQRDKRDTERERYRCIAAQRRIGDARTAAIADFNRAWRPALEAAAAHGDGVAEVVLRLCETAPLLDRTGIAADCSNDAADQAIARRRLEAVGFAPALYHYRAPQTWPEHYESPCARDDTTAARQCRLRESAQRFAQLQRVMESGAMSVAPRYANCGHAGNDDKVLVDGCERAWMLDQAIAVRARRFYIMASDGADALSLQRDPPVQPFEYRGTAWPYDTLGRVRYPDNREIDDPAWQDAFYSDVERALQREEAAIRADLARDPRWAAFLLLRHAPPAPSGQARYFGTWRGSIGAVDFDRTVTVFSQGGNNGGDIEGYYLGIHRDGSVDWGELHPCLELPRDNLLCQWQDNGGHGFVNFHFDFRNGRFQGLWDGSDTRSFPYRGPYEGDNGGGWNGVRD